MKTILFLMCVFYNQSKRSVENAPPHLATILLFSLLTWMDLAAIASFFGIHILITSGLVSMITVFILLPLFFNTVGPREVLEHPPYDAASLKSGRKWLWIWVLASILLMVVSRTMFR
jgi:hypothetical protein